MALASIPVHLHTPPSQCPRCGSDRVHGPLPGDRHHCSSCLTGWTAAPPVDAPPVCGSCEFNWYVVRSDSPQGGWRCRLCLSHRPDNA